MPLWQVVQEMALTLEGKELPAPSASVQVRQRLGAQPMEHLFALLANAWGRAHAVHAGDLRVLAVDGVVWSAPDSQDNRQELGSGQTQYGPQPWPMVRAVCLLDTDSHELLDAPLAQFKAWFDQAKTAGVIEPNAMVLSTLGLDGFPSSRTVLLKAADERGFSFFTNYDSKKGEEIAANPQVTLLFPWFSLERQIHITGSLIKTSEEESVTYFARRPYGSQLGALASDQSDIIADRGVLEARLAELKAKHPEGQVPKPLHWGGYRLVPTSFEFWQGRTNRLHDRFHYSLNKGVWDIVRLSP